MNITTLIYRLAFLSAALTLALPTLAEVTAPRVGEVQLAQPLPLPYTAGDATSAVDQALARAEKSNKRVLLDLGGNWCGDCRVFAGILQVPSVRSFVDQHFEVVLVDVGRFTDNLAIPARFGVPKLAAAPDHSDPVSQGEIAERRRGRGSA